MDPKIPNLEDFIPIYPEQTDPDIQVKIAARKEFRDVAAQVNEDKPSRGDKFAHQKLFERIMRVYDRMLLISEPGTGKTLSFLAVTEYLKNHSMYNKAYIIGPGPTVLNDAKRQLICKATKFGVYETRAVNEAKSMLSRKNLLTRSLSKFYSFESHKGFANKISNKTDKELEMEFSGCVFIIDEAHNITNTKNQTSMYFKFKRLFEKVRRTKIILATATPMINKADELRPLMNLILPEERRFPENFNFEKLKPADIIDRCKGFVSYVRAEGLLASAQYMGSVRASERGIDKILPVQARPVIYISEMGDLQFNVFKRVVGRTKSKLVDDEEGKDAFMSKTKQISTFVFPDGSYGGIVDGSGDDITITRFAEDTGLAKYVEQTKPGEYAFKTNRELNKKFREWEFSGGAKSFKEWLSGVGRPDSTPVLYNLNRVSCKTASIIDIELTHLNDPGTSFIYSEAKNGGGAILLGLCFELFGFSRFKPSSKKKIITEDDDDDEELELLTTLDPYCSNSGDSKSAVQGLEKKPRYALLIGDGNDSSDSQKEEIFKIFNSPENVKGEYIKVLIGSQITRDGINLHHVVRVHLYIPQFTVSGMIQAVARAMRATSHNDLFELKKEQVKHDNPTMDDGRVNEIAHINVNIYRHAAKPLEGDLPFVDSNIYSLAAKKDYDIRNVMRYLKTSSIDCILNRNRNVERPLSKQNLSDYSAECDYNKCEYECASNVRLSDIPIDYQTYDVIYLNEQIHKAMGYLYTQELLRTPSEVVRPQDSCPGHRTMAVFNAIDKMIQDQPRLKDGFGRVSYLTLQRDGSVYLSSDLTHSNYSVMTGNSGSNLFGSTYSINPLYVLRRSLRGGISETYKAQLDFIKNPENKYDKNIVYYVLELNPSNIDNLKFIEYIYSSIILGKVPRVRPEAVCVSIEDISMINTVYVSTVGIVRSVYKSLVKEKQSLERCDKGMITQVSPGTPDDAIILFNFYLENEGEEVTGQYSKTQGGTSKMDNIIRVFVPYENGGHTDCWRYAYPYSEGRSLKLLRDMGTTNTKFPFERFKLFLEDINLIPPKLEKFSNEDVKLIMIERPPIVEKQIKPKSNHSLHDTNSLLYGVVMSNDGSFRIVDRRTKQTSRGRLCTTLDYIDLLSIIVDLTDTPNVDDLLNLQSDSDYKTELKLYKTESSKITPDKIEEFFYNSSKTLRDHPNFNSKKWRENLIKLKFVSRKGLCVYIKKLMEDKHLIRENI